MNRSLPAFQISFHKVHLPVEYVNLGNAGVKVSPIVMGMGLREQPDAREAQRLVGRAIDSGINFFDCANRYGLGDDRVHKRGSAEEVLGRVLESRRDEVVITTKVTGSMGPGPNDEGGSRYHILAEVEQSLRRLRTDHIDIYLLHGYTHDTPLEETLRALDDLVTQGKVRYVGCCNFEAWQVCKALWTADRLGADPFMCVQNEYSLLKRSPESELFGLIRDQGLGMMAYSPLAAGLLSGAYGPGDDPPRGSLWRENPQSDFKSALPPQAGHLIEMMRQIAGSRGKSVPQVALNWVLSHPEVTVAISGIDNVERLEENLGAVGWTLEEDELARLDEASTAVADRS